MSDPGFETSEPSVSTEEGGPVGDPAGDAAASADEVQSSRAPAAAWEEAMAIIHEMMRDLAELRSAAAPPPDSAMAQPPAEPADPPEADTDDPPQSADAEQARPIEEGSPEGAPDGPGARAPAAVDGPGEAAASGPDAPEESAGQGTVLALLNVEATSGGGEHIFALVSESGERVDDPHFEIVGDELRLKPGAGAELGPDSTHELTVLVADSNGGSNIQTVQVRVTAEAIDAASAEAEARADETMATEGWDAFAASVADKLAIDGPGGIADEAAAAAVEADASAEDAVEDDVPDAARRTASAM